MRRTLDWGRAGRILNVGEKIYVPGASPDPRGEYMVKGVSYPGKRAHVQPSRSLRLTVTCVHATRKLPAGRGLCSTRTTHWGIVHQKLSSRQRRCRGLAACKDKCPWRFNPIRNGAFVSFDDHLGRTGNFALQPPPCPERVLRATENEQFTRRIFPRTLQRAGRVRPGVHEEIRRRPVEHLPVSVSHLIPVP
jgi:hypothetical protein